MWEDGAGIGVGDDVGVGDEIRSGGGANGTAVGAVSPSVRDRRQRVDHYRRVRETRTRQVADRRGRSRAGLPTQAGEAEADVTGTETAKLP